MSNTTASQKHGRIEKFASSVSRTTGSTGAFILAFASVLVWVATGPVFHFSPSWLLFMNTGASVVTFLMVFLIQKAQNKDSLAIQLKLNELVAAHEFASNRLVNVESMSEEELRVIQKYYSKLSQVTQNEEGLRGSRSIDEATLLQEVAKEITAGESEPDIQRLPDDDRNPF
jgi:low affinity Fe/Cu permease